MTKKITEYDALKGVDELIEPLEPEERKRVFDYVNGKYKIYSSQIAVPNATQTGAFNSTMPPGVATSTAPVVAGNIKSFVLAKRPKDPYEKIACIAYYLEKVEGLEALTRKNITQAFEDARLSPMSNPSLFINRTANTHGYLTPLGKNKALSPRGEALVDALPDREKANIALADHPVRGKSKSKRRKKKIKA